MADEPIPMLVAIEEEEKWVDEETGRWCYRFWTYSLSDVEPDQDVVAQPQARGELGRAAGRPEAR
jgi:hypothetical protein